jgi:hypothetical protein
LAHSTLSRLGLFAAVLASTATGGWLSPIDPAQAGFDRAAVQSTSPGVLVATTIRVIRRSTVYVATLPKGCVRTEINNTVVWRCGKTYYEADGNRYVLVYID